MEQENLRGYQNGSKVNRRSPLENREASDRGYIILWAVVFVLWLIFIIVAMTAQPDTSTELGSIGVRVQAGFLDTMNAAKGLFVQFGYVAIALFAVILGVIIGSIGLAQVRPNYFSFLARGAVTLLLVNYVYALYYQFRAPVVVVDGIPQKQNGDIYSIYNHFILLTYKILFAVTAIYCIYTKKYEHATGYIAKSARLFYIVPSFIAFSLFIFTLAMLMLALSGWALYIALANITIFLICSVFIVICLAYLVPSIYYFGIATLSLAAATREWSESQGTTKPTSSVLASAGHVLRYKLGTIAYTATLVGPLVSGFFAWLRSSRTHIPTERQQPLERAIDIVIMGYLILYNSCYTLMISAIEGKDYTGSVTKLYTHFRKQSVSLYSFVWLFFGAQAFVFIILVLSLCLVGEIMIIVYAVQNDVEGRDGSLAGMVSSLIFVVIICAPVNMVLDAIGLTGYFHKLTLEEDANEPQDKMSAVPLRQV